MKRKRIAALSVLLFAGLISACAKETKPQQDVTPAVETTTKNALVRTDVESIKAGKLLFTRKCSYCHDPSSDMKLGGPGLKGILKNPLLPVSKKSATAENIANQMRHPLTNMPSFVYLDENDVENIIAYLNTL